jgi:hypothetical protein
MATILVKKWKPIYLVQIYRLVRLGMSDPELCQTLDVSRQSLWNWKRRYPEVREAYNLAKKDLHESESFPRWVFSRLSPELKEVWRKIRKWEKEDNGVVRIEAMLEDRGKRVRQQLFLHALCVSRFSPTIAMMRVNLAKGELDRWINTDPEFAALVEEMQWHKGNFFEESLVQLVKEGNPAAVIFANKSYNAKRGYNPIKNLGIDVNVHGQVNVGVFDLADVMQFLSEASKLELLQAIRRKEAQDNPRLTAREILSQQIAEIPPEENSENFAGM